MTTIRLGAVALLVTLTAGCATSRDPVAVEPSLQDVYLLPESGEIFVPSATQPNTLERLGIVMREAQVDATTSTGIKTTPPQTCVTTTQTVCTEWVPSASSYSGRICVNTATVTTVTCT